MSADSAGTTSPSAVPWLRALRFTVAPARSWAGSGLAGQSPATITFAFLLPLLLAAALAGVIGYAVVGLNTQGFSYKLGWLQAITQAGVAFVATLLLLVLLAWAAKALAPRFGGKLGFAEAWLVVTHAGSPIWLAGLVMVLPALMPVIWAAAIVSVYVLHIGLGTIARPQPNRGIPYTGAVVATAVVLLVLLGLLSNCAVKTKGATESVAVPTTLDRNEKVAIPKDDAATKARASKEEISAGTGKGGAGLAGDAVGVGSALELEPRKAPEVQGDPLKGILHGGDLPRTRTVLASYLPKPAAAHTRQTIDNYAFNAPPTDAAKFLSRGAFVLVRDKLPGPGHKWRSLAIKDLGDIGPSAAAALLSEVGETGGERDLFNGRVKRTVTELGTRWAVTEHETKREPSRANAKYELLLGQRYLITAESVGVPLDELREWVASMDLAGLEARAAAKKPIE